MPDAENPNATLLALSGTIVSPGLPAGTSYQDPWLDRWFALIDRLGRALTVPCGLEVYKDDSGALKFGVRAGRYMNAATAVSYAGAADQALTNNQTNYIYLTAAGALTINTSGFPAASVPHLPLATIATGTASVAGTTGIYAIEDITDYRGLILFQLHGTELARYPVDLRLNCGDFTIDEGGWGVGTLTISGDEARNNTVVNALPLQFALPPDYVASADVKVVVHAKVDDSGGGTLGTCTVDVEVYELDDEGAVGADICATAAIAVTNAFGDKTFTITDAGLTPGDRISVLLRTSIEENADAGELKALIGSIELQADRRG